MKSNFHPKEAELFCSQTSSASEGLTYDLVTSSVTRAFQTAFWEFHVKDFERYSEAAFSAARTCSKLIVERPDTWVTVCTGHIGDTSSPRGGSDALEGVFGYG